MKKETKQNTNKMNIQKLVFHFLPLPALERVNVEGNFNSLLKEIGGSVYGGSALQVSTL